MKRMLVARLTRMSLAAAVAVGAVTYVGLRIAATDTRADAATPPTIVIGHNAATRGYTTKRLVVHKGQTVRVVNHDTMRHTVTSDATNSHHQPLFSAYVVAGQSTTLTTSKLPAGRYPFHCNFHPAMRGVLVVRGSGGTGGGQSFNIALLIPPVRRTANITIPVERAAVRVFAKGPKTMMWTYGGTYPGPTIVRPAGQDTKVTFVDKLPKSVGAISVHLHGDHHESRFDGQPTTSLLQPGHARTYDYPLTDGGQAEHASFFYYHDHRMLETGRNNWMGLQGMFLVTRRDERFGLPSGKYDVPLAISDRSFTSTNQLRKPFPAHPMMEMTGPSAPPNDETVGNTVLVNGRYSPYFNVDTHRYRLRLLNASNFQSYDFELSDGQSFTQLGSGDSLFPNPVQRKDILLGPSQRADVVVNFGGEFGKRIVLKSVPRVNRPPKGIGSPTASLMQFRVTGKTASAGNPVPNTLLKLPDLSKVTTISKVWAISVGHNSNGSYWAINGKMFDPKRTDYTVKAGSTEQWQLVNNSNITHYFHIHEEQWRTISRDGHTPKPFEMGLQDTWRLDPGENVVVQATFTSDFLGTFMLHCHMLDHEDHGLMAQFKVVP